MNSFHSMMRRFWLLATLLTTTTIVTVATAEPSKPPAPASGEQAKADDKDDDGDELPPDPLEQAQVKISRAGVPSNPTLRPTKNCELFELAWNPNKEIEIGDGLVMKLGDLRDALNKLELANCEVGSTITDERVWVAPEDVHPSAKKRLAAQEREQEAEINKIKEAAKAQWRSDLARTGGRRVVARHRVSRAGGVLKWPSKMIGVQTLEKTWRSKPIGSRSRIGGDFYFSMKNRLEGLEKVSLAAEGGVTAYVFKRPFSVVRVTVGGSAERGKGLKANGALSFFGQTVATFTKGTSRAGIKERWPIAGAEVGFTFPVGPIPVRVSAGVNGAFTLPKSVDRDPNTLLGVRGTVRPGIQLDVYAKAGVSIMVAEAGIKGAVSLLKFGIPASASIGIITPQEGKFALAQRLAIDLETVLGSGSVALYVSAKGPNPICWACKAIAAVGNLVSKAFDSNKRGLFIKIKKGVKGIVKGVKKAVKKVAKVAVKIGKTVAKVAKKVGKVAVKVAKTAINVVKNMVACDFYVEQKIITFNGKTIRTPLIGFSNPPVVSEFPNGA